MDKASKTSRTFKKTVTLLPWSQREYMYIEEHLEIKGDKEENKSYKQILTFWSHAEKH